MFILEVHDSVKRIARLIMRAMCRLKAASTLTAAGRLVIQSCSFPAADVPLVVCWTSQMSYLDDDFLTVNTQRVKPATDSSSPSTEQLALHLRPPAKRAQFACLLVMRDWTLDHALMMVANCSPSIPRP